METCDVVIVGAGHGGAQVAIALRQAKFEGSITVLGEEPELPCERPPLSKDYLAGKEPFERLLIRPVGFWAERRIAMRVGQRVVELRPDAHQVVTEAGVVIGYRHLVWATGGAPRRLSCVGHDLAGVHAVRTRADVDALILELPATASVAVSAAAISGSRRRRC